MSHIPTTNAAPGATDFGVPVRVIGAGGGGGIAVVEPAYTATGSVKAYNAADQELLAAAATRHGFEIFNATDRALYIKIGGAATAIDATAIIQPNQLYTSFKRTTATVHGIGLAGGVGNIFITSYTL